LSGAPQHRHWHLNHGVSAPTQLSQPPFAALELCSPKPQPSEFANQALSTSNWQLHLEEAAAKVAGVGSQVSAAHDEPIAFPDTGQRPQSMPQ
jgi:hypothetical protein